LCVCFIVLLFKSSNVKLFVLLFVLLLYCVCVFIVLLFKLSNVKVLYYFMLFLYCVCGFYCTII